MNLEILYFLAQIAAALVVIGTLVYGIVQLRINNRLMKVQLSHSTLHSNATFNLSLGMDRQAARIWRKGLKGDTDLDEDERMQFALLCGSSFNGFESHFMLEAEGLIREELAERYRHQLRHIVSRPGVRQLWPHQRANFNKYLQEEVDRMIGGAGEL